MGRPSKAQLGERELKRQENRARAENDLEFFINLVHPNRLLGNIHREVIRWWCRKEALTHQLLLLPRDHMKDLDLDCKVKTFSGWTKVRNIKVGDTIVGFDGLPQTVLALQDIAVRERYRVRTSDGRETICGKEHLWSVYMPSNYGDKLITKPLSYFLDKYKTKRFDKRVGPDYKTWEYRVFLPLVSPIQYEEKDLPIDPYTLGVWLGDGTSANGNITTADPEILTYFPYISKKLKSKYTYNVEGLHTLLRKNGLKKNKHVPSNYLLGSVEQRISLLQGLMDSDGCCHRDGRNAYFYNTNEKLTDGVVDLVRGLGGIANKYRHNSSFNGVLFPSWIVSIKFQNDINPFLLPRKANKWKGSRGKGIAIVDIEKIEDGETRCISVSNPDGLFITDDYTVTHNSALIAYRVAWELTKDPTLRVLYISSTSNLATKQLKFIKDIFLSDNYRLHWPDMVEKEEAKREKWTEKEISLDHPKRKDEAIRDPSIFTAGLTTNITGLHCDIAVMDDVVVQGNAYTEEGREKVREQYGYLSSIETANAREWIVGTRYHPRDLYSDLLEKEIETYDSDGNLSNRVPLFEILERQVESIGDGTGEFLWPRQQRSDGKWFGFSAEILAIKRSQYVNKTHFRAQYYNDPQDAESSPINRSLFQYYDPAYLMQKEGRWFFRGERINVFASIDFAFSLGKKADSTAIVVVGLDGKQNYYILEIDRFKTDSPSEYFKRILAQYQKWGFRKIRAEVSVAQQVIVKDLKESYIKPMGLSLVVEEYRPSRWQGSKEERILATLEPKYANGQIWHYPGGNCQILEEELIFTNPPHDDVKDALASCIDFAVAPTNFFGMKKPNQPTYTFNSRFGGLN